MEKSTYLKKSIILCLLLVFMGNCFALSHTVQKGDTFYSISRKYNVSVEQLCSENNLSKDSVLKIGQVLKIPQVEVLIEYTVQKGDNLSVIAKRQNTTVDHLCQINKISKDSVLKIGQKIKVPQVNAEIKSSATTSNSSTSKTAATQNSTKVENKTTTNTTSSSSNTNTSSSETQRKYDIYTIQKGDTLYSISKVNGITVDELKQLNGLDDKSTLKIGQKLKIPVTIIDTKNSTLPELAANDPRSYSTKKGDSTLTWPVKNPEVTYIKGKVYGVQLTCQNNEKVTCVRSGTVMYVGNYRGWGQVVFVQSKTEHIYVYSGLGTIKVKKGDYIVFGDEVGTAGIDSIKGTSQITFMVFQKSKAIDPATAPRG